MIAGKTNDEILSMNDDKRYRWYKTILPKEKEKAKMIVAIERGRKIGIANASRIVSKETRAKASISLSGKKHPMYGKTGKDNPNFGSTCTEQTKTKQREWWTSDRRAKQSEAMMGENNPSFGGLSGEHKDSLSEAWTPEKKVEQSNRIITLWTPERRSKMMGENNPSFGGLSEKTKNKISVALMGHTTSEETRVKQSESMLGEKHWNWQNGKSYKPYCLSFNEKRKEYIRNFYNRTCTTCGKSTLQNIGKNGKWLGRLDVDHVDENKMQGCNDWEWRLTPLCPFCHGKMQKQENHLLLQLLLLNNKKHQTNFLFGDEYNV